MTAAVVVAYGLICVMSASAACLLGLNWRVICFPPSVAPSRPLPRPAQR